MARIEQLSREQKHALAMLLLTKAGDIVESWDELIIDVPELADSDLRAAKEQLTAWLKYLPGSAWDRRLPKAHSNCEWCGYRLTT